MTGTLQVYTRRTMGSPIGRLAEDAQERAKFYLTLNKDDLDGTDAQNLARLVVAELPDVTDGKCGTCLHWIRRDGDYKSSHEFHRCDSPRFALGYNVDISKLAPNQVHVEDDEGWGFFTGPEFGCVHWEKA
jgi:hypothetical protein